jgi:predicted nucleic acid-binding protein
MSVLIDTPVWSFAYRRAKRSASEQAIVNELTELIQRERAVLTGAIRQEVLSGISNAKLFENVRSALRGFVELVPTIADYERAAEFCNLCRHIGIQGSPTDFLICAIAARYDVEIYTTDRDFKRYAACVGIKLHGTPRS